MYASLTSFTRHTHSPQTGLYITSLVSDSLTGLRNGIEVSIGHCRGSLRISVQRSYDVPHDEDSGCMFSITKALMSAPASAKAFMR